MDVEKIIKELGVVPAPFGLKDDAKELLIPYLEYKKFLTDKLNITNSGFEKFVNEVTNQVNENIYNAVKDSDDIDMISHFKDDLKNVIRLVADELYKYGQSEGFVYDEEIAKESIFAVLMIHSDVEF